MKKYIENLNKEIQEYFYVLLDGEEIPEFLFKYINTPEMKRIGKIGMNCGTDYTKIFNNKYFYTRLEHSIGVALIIWNFTKDKKQSLSGLFHDIATPCFSHCIDFLHKDYLKQESTEEKTKKIIENSKEIMNLLNKDNILLDEVCNYKIYPIADNKSPRLSADRLEYTLSSGMTFSQVWNIEDIKKIYSNLVIIKNDDNIDEICFKDKKIAEKFVYGASIMWKMFQSSEDKIVMQFLADTIKIMSNENIFKEEDLYIYSEKEIIKKIENCGIKEIEKSFKNFRNSTYVCEGNNPPNDNYFINLNVKKRYINPLVNEKRIVDISNNARKVINDFLNIKTSKYCWFDFNVTNYYICD